MKEAKWNGIWTDCITMKNKLYSGLDQTIVSFFTKLFILYRIVKPFSGAIQNALTELHSYPGSQVMTQNVNVFVVAGAHFKYKINTPKISSFRPFVFDFYSILFRQKCCTERLLRYYGAQ